MGPPCAPLYLCDTLAGVTVPLRSQLHPSFGLLLEAPEPVRLATLEIGWVTAQLRQSGVILFRGFDVDGLEFEWFTQRYSERFCLDEGVTRAAVGHLQPETRSVISPRPDQPFGLHAELASSTAHRPRLLWLLCVEPTMRGGETWVCDGESVYRSLSPRTQAIFGPGVLVRHRGKAAVPVLSQAPGAAAPAFANALVGRSSFATICRQVTFADGRPLDRAAWQEARDRCEAMTAAVRWQRGDVLMVDNLRCMHGRSAFDGDELRVLYSRVAWDLRSGA
jgi:alpha-ketoglutarate-dependent taurine dioxygenase